MNYQNTIIRASAGTGKTYQLALRYIALLVLGVQPQRIIALTFTKKAAGEFRERILQRLAAAATTAEQAESLAADIARTICGTASQAPLVHEAWQPTTPLDTAFFTQLLKAVIQQYSRLQLSTIDSFSKKLAQAMAIDAGIADITPCAEEDLQAQRDEVLSLLYSTPELQDELTNAYHVAMGDKPSSRMDDLFKEFIADYQSLYLDNPPLHIWGADPSTNSASGNSVPSLLPINQWCHTQAPWWQEFNHHLEYLIDLLRQLEEERDTLPEALLAPWETNNKMLRGHLFNAAPLKFDAGLLKEWHAPEGAPYAITFRKKTHDLPQEWADKLYTLLGGCIKRQALYLQQKTVSINTLMTHYEQFYDTNVRSLGYYTFDDITRTVAKIAWNDDTRQQKLQDLHFRLDGEFDHWMLDEFQDTSFNQWQILRPILDDALQNGEGNKSIFIVGDTKQSIYQWRGGNPHIFASLTHGAWSEQFQPWSMSTSFRSSKAVLDFVNLICKFDSSAHALASPQAYRTWDFDTHSPAGAAISSPGLVQVWHYGKSNEEEDAEEEQPDTAAATTPTKAPAYFPQMLDLILPLAPLLSPDFTCAVLVNVNKEALHVYKFLNEAGIPAQIDADAYIAQDSPLGLALHSFFVWLAYPADAAAQLHLLGSPLRVLLSHATAEKPHIDQDWLHWMQLYEHQGIGELLRTIRSTLLEHSPQCLPPAMLGRMNSFIEFADAFDSSGGTLESWLKLLPTLKKAEQSTTGHVQIMTIHKAKGLEFNTVIIPFAKSNLLTGKRKDAVIRRLTPQGEVQQIMARPSSTLANADEECLGSIMQHYSAEKHYEAFCKLYVALTRAKNALFILIPSLGKGATINPASFGAIIRQGIGQTHFGGGVFSPSSDDENPLFQSGNPAWLQHIQDRLLHGQQTRPTATSTTQSAPLLPPPQAGHVLPRISPSTMGHQVRADTDPTSYERESRDSAPLILLDKGIQHAIHFGSDVHEIFSTIAWLPLDDTPPPLVHPNERALHAVLATLSVPEVAALFTRPNAPDTILLREQHLLAHTEPKEDPALISGVVDRAHFADGVWTIIDFKTDKVSVPQQLTDRYVAQLSCYADLLCRTTGSPASTARCIIISTHLNQAIEITGSSIGC